MTNSYIEQTGTANPFNGINVGLYSTPTLADLDADGDLDAIIGEYDGILNYYQNTGSSSNPVYSEQTGTANPFNGIDIGKKSIFESLKVVGYVGRTHLKAVKQESQ
jgi:hypothetical protein